jgi:ribonuclease HI
MVVEMTLTAACTRDAGTWTCSLVAGPDRKELQGADTLTTKDRLELAAAIAGFAALKRRCGVELYTESIYLLQAAALFPTWKTFKGSTPKHQMRNQALWDQLYEVASRHDVNWRGPRASHEVEFTDVMTETTSEIRGRTQGTGRDVGCLYAGSASPWSKPTLGEYRAFNDEEIRAEEICSNVGADDIEDLTSTQRHDRERVIARIVNRASLENDTRARPLAIRTLPTNKPSSTNIMMTIPRNSFDHAASGVL